MWAALVVFWGAFAVPGVAVAARSAEAPGTGALAWPGRVSPAALASMEVPAFVLEADRDATIWPDDNGAAPPAIETPGELEPPVRWLPRVTLFTENDGGFVKPNNATDRYYTAGNGLSVTFRPRWAEDLAAWVYAQPRHRANAAGLFVGQLLFTPEDLSDPELIVDDHPYAGYLYGGLFWQSAGARSLDHVRVEIGTLGSGALADRAQEWVHAVFGGDRPRGWEHQHVNEITLQAFYLRKGRMFEEPFGLDGLSGAFEILPEVGLALGTVQRHAEVGATLRYGINLPSDFGPARLDDLSGTDGEYQPGFGTYVFARGSGRAVQRDVFIEGSDFRGGHGVDAERLVGRVEGGLRLYYQHDYWNLELGYSQTYLTPQFREQRGSHAYASLTLSMTMSF